MEPNVGMTETMGITPLLPGHEVRDGPLGVVAVATRARPEGSHSRNGAWLRSPPLLALLGVAVIASACSVGTAPSGSNGSGSETANSHNTLSVGSSLTRHQAAQRFLSISRPVSAAATTLQKKMNNWTARTTNVDMTVDARPVVAAISRAVPHLRALARAYPPAAADLNDVIAAASAISTDLSRLSSLGTLHFSSWKLQFQRDETSKAAAIAILRSELGLPWLSS